MLWALNSPIPIYVADEREHRGSAASRQFGRSILPGAMPQSLLLSLLWRSSIHIATLRLRSMRRSEIAPLEEPLCCAVVANDIPSLSGCGAVMRCTVLDTVALDASASALSTLCCGPYYRQSTGSPVQVCADLLRLVTQKAECL
jgi:hypothetical protein